MTIKLCCKTCQKFFDIDVEDNLTGEQLMFVIRQVNKCRVTHGIHDVFYTMEIQPSYRFAGERTLEISSPIYIYISHVQ